MNISNKINMVDDIFANYMDNHNKKSFEKDLKTLIDAFTNKQFEIRIVDTSAHAREPFFGMRVFPLGEEMDEFCKELTEDNTVSISDMCNRWRSIEKWVIEVDDRIFDRMTINFNPQEMTAMLLHEVGHTIYADKTFEMFYRVYKECRIRLTSADKASSKLLYFLYSIPLTVMCGIRDWNLTNKDLKEEVFADQSVNKLGYEEYLVSAYNKIIKVYGETSGYSDDYRKEDTLKNSITWCNLNIHDLVYRKNKLKDKLYSTGIRTNSIYMQGLIRSIMDKLSLRKQERYTGSVVVESNLTIDFDDENFVLENNLIYDIKGFSNLTNRIRSVRERAENAVANEAFGKTKDQIPNQLDVDTIFVEVDRIENHADRRYVLDLIYNQEEKIEKFKETFKYNKDLKKKYSGKMESMLKELASMRQAVLNKRSFDKEYKVFVKYPAGYEG